MRNKLYIIGIILSFFACENEQKAEESCSSNTKKKIVIRKDVNPNGTSELAGLMRDIFEESEKYKLQIEAGEEFEVDDAYVDKIKKFHAASPTKPHMKEGGFNAFAAAIELSADGFKNASQEEQKEKFNNLVQSCVVCHEQVCPGPLVRINKLPIQ